MILLGHFRRRRAEASNKPCSIRPSICNTNSWIISIFSSSTTCSFSPNTFCLSSTISLFHSPASFSILSSFSLSHSPTPSSSISFQHLLIPLNWLLILHLTHHLHIHLSLIHHRVTPILQVNTLESILHDHIDAMFLNAWTRIVHKQVLADSFISVVSYLCLVLKFQDFSMTCL